MSNQEILTKAIQKAIAAGWKPKSWSRDTIRSFMIDYKPEQYIFNHDFAKALWGEEIPNPERYDIEQTAWSYHLQQMVIAEDAIKYLGEHLND